MEGFKRRSANPRVRPLRIPLGPTGLRSLTRARRSRRRWWLLGFAGGVAALSWLGLPPSQSASSSHAVTRKVLPDEPRPPGQQDRRALSALTIYWAPRAERPRRAVVGVGGVFAIEGKPRPSADCKGGWAAVVGGGYACLDDTEPAATAAEAVPRLVDDLVPFVYVQRRSDPGYKLAFLPDESGDGLVRMGKPLDADRYEKHEPSRFAGRDLRRRPVPKGHVPAWVVQPDVPLFGAPADERPALALPMHTELVVNERPRKVKGRAWYQVRLATGEKRTGFLPEDAPLRRWRSAKEVSGVAADELWIDVDTSQQVLALRRGRHELLYVTLISGGLPERPTPRGIFRITHKYAYRTMGSLPESADKHFIENVPWTMYFKPHYAIHGAYWHDEFGNQRSHGCVNLAPRDAAFIYERVAPEQQPGFFQTFASDHAPGTVVRIREGAEVDVPDERDDAA